MPAIPLGSEAVVMTSVAGEPAASMTRLRAAVADCAGLLESLTVIATEDVPAEVGVPVMAPVAALIWRPLGRPVALKV